MSNEASSSETKRPDEEVNLRHFPWLLKSRATTLDTSFKLYCALESPSAKGLSDRHRRVAAKLVFVGFSLWRAAFLAKREGAESQRHAIKFLERMIEDNAIGYPQDKEFNAWTFRYYADTAIVWLNQLSKDKEKWLDGELSMTGETKKRWERGQQGYEEAVAAFVKTIIKKEPKKKRTGKSS